MAAIKKGFLAFCSQEPNNSIGFLDKPVERKEISNPQFSLSLKVTKHSSILRPKDPKHANSKRKVRFAATTSQRAFSLFQCHEMVVPSTGAYPLGLGDLLQECSGPLHDHSAEMKEGDTKMSLARRYPCSDKRYLLPKIPESERIKRLKSHEAFREKEGVIECETTRESRASNFCQCKQLVEDGNCCQDETCPCVANGINCHIEGPRCCSCSIVFRTSFSSTMSPPTTLITLPSTVSDLSSSSSSPSTTVLSLTSSCFSFSTATRASGCMNPHGRYIFNETEAKRRRLSLLGKIIVTTPKNSPMQEVEIVKVNLNDFLFQERGGVLM